jgi:hypothetical protein
MEFKPTIPAFERVKTVHALDRAATVIGWLSHYFVINKSPLPTRYIQVNFYTPPPPVLKPDGSAAYDTFDTSVTETFNMTYRSLLKSE